MGRRTQLVPPHYWRVECCMCEGVKHAVWCWCNLRRVCLQLSTCGAQD